VYKIKEKEADITFSAMEEKTMRIVGRV